MPPLPRTLTEQVVLANPSPTIYMGLDPGVSGGFVVICPDNTIVLQPANKLDIQGTWDFINSYRPSKTTEVFAILEKVGGYAGNWESGGNGPAMFTFGASFGSLRGFLVAAGIEYQEVTPQSWLKTFGLKKEKGEKATAWKNRLKAKADDILVDLVGHSSGLTLATSDALLMAEHGRRLRNGG